MKRMTKTERVIKENEALLEENKKIIDKLIEDNKNLIFHIKTMKKLVNLGKKKK